MRYFNGLGEFLALFEVDETKPGAEDFVTCVICFSAVYHRNLYGISIGMIARRVMSERRVSPMLFWSRMKKAMRAVLDAAPESLIALGLPSEYVPTDHPMTCPELIRALGSVTVLKGVTDDDISHLIRMVSQNGEP